ncbi:hypothetical protein KP509_11G086900 [Ceratopteris richardii]|uniref:ATP-dependent helicase ATRX n=1 Tax=Ceratopteris richardii TaxID=49495 RepID=A0A8T2TXI8_CERRI|nr:hypothetical protein KP509_11G086900 [Ceratopteris richardii]
MDDMQKGSDNELETSESSDECSIFDEDECSLSDGDSNAEVPLTEEEIQDLIDQLFEVESKAAEAQEMLEEESLASIKREIREELSANLSGPELDEAVEEEMLTFAEQWQEALDRLEDKSGLIQEQLDDAGIELSMLFKWLEKQAPQCCTTEAWKKRTHWAGALPSHEVSKAVQEAENDLDIIRPVKRHRGKLIEEGASGYLEKKVLDRGFTHCASGSDTQKGDGWRFLDSVLEKEHNEGKPGCFGSKAWASVYLAATPEQAALLGLPGSNEVEEIDDLEKCKDILTAEAIANERESGLTEMQRKNIKKVKEEEDIKRTKLMDQFIFKRKRKRKPGSSSISGPSNQCIDKGQTTWHINCPDVHPDQNIGGAVIINIDSDEEQIPSKFTESVRVMEQAKLYFQDAVKSLETSELPYAVGKEDRTNDAFNCTVCGKKLRPDQVNKHPLFDVIICKPCRKFYQSGPITKDSSGRDNECSWCANGGNIVFCDGCDKVFCEGCIKLNFGDQKYQQIIESEQWLCYCCDTELLMPKITRFLEASELKSIGSSNQANSQSDEFIELRQHEKRRKRLRRIIEDDELEESTIIKQRLEKERKERLDRLRDSANNIGTDMTSTTSTLEKCAINVVRDPDEEEVLIPSGIATFLKPHQIEGVQFMWENCIESIKKVKAGDPGNGCILAHSMGLGKTLQIIAFLYTVLKKKDLGLRTALIVTPVNVLHNWPDEFEKWKPAERKGLRVYVLDETSRNIRKKLLHEWQKTGGVMMIGYSTFRTMSLGKYVKYSSEKDEIRKALQNPGPDILVCDEAHMIKNKKADITLALKQMVDFVREGFLGRPQDFKNRFQNPIENGQHADSTDYDVRCMKERTHVLHKQLMGFVQRKGASIVENELPKKLVYVISVRLSPLQRALYNRFLQYFWLTNEQSVMTLKSRKSLFPTYHALAKVWNHPDLLFTIKEEKDILSEDSMDECFDEDVLSTDEDISMLRKEDKKFQTKSQVKTDPDGLNLNANLDWCKDLIDIPLGTLDYSGKLVLLLDILTMSSARGDKALVFSQSIPTLNLIENFLARIPRPKGKAGGWRKDKEWYRLDGQTSARERQKLVKRFNNPSNLKVQCVLISTKAGSLGINLQAANRVVIVDGSWNPTHDIQALFRVWRFGQMKAVVIYRLLAFGTAEEKIYKRQVAKESLAARVLDAQQIERHSKMDELRVLFKLDEHANEQSTSNMGRTSNTLDHDPPEDDIMTSLLIDHRPKWIVGIHKHDTLLEDREDEKLTVEEQELAWEKFRRIADSHDVDWVQINSQPEISSCVSNSWSGAGYKMPESTCSFTFHAMLLQSTSTKNNEHVRCGACQEEIGWEHIAKSKHSKLFP